MRDGRPCRRSRRRPSTERCTSTGPTQTGGLKEVTSTGGFPELVATGPSPVGPAVPPQVVRHGRRRSNPRANPDPPRNAPQRRYRALHGLAVMSPHGASARPRTPRRFGTSGSPLPTVGRKHRLRRASQGAEQAEEPRSTTRAPGSDRLTSRLRPSCAGPVGFPVRVVRAARKNFPASPSQRLAAGHTVDSARDKGRDPGFCAAHGPTEVGSVG